jgi:PAS domain S-box-containing protein
MNTGIGTDGRAFFYEAVLDNIPDGIYVLDDKGNYVYVNSAYVRTMCVTKQFFEGFNVHDLLESGEIDFCISDIVYREKRRVVMFQDVYGPRGGSRKHYRQLVISTPVFNASGEVRNIVACVRPVDEFNRYYREANKCETVSLLSNTRSFEHTQLLAESSAMREVLELAKTVAYTDSTVLITGESGTGKEMIAQYIHRLSSRNERNALIVNCASLPPALLEAELFGYEKGAYTGAAANGKIGLFEEAAGGTLVLDEINSIPLELQGKLLRAIENKQIKRIGSNKTRNVDFRLIAVTNEDLDQLVLEKRFRADLYYRLNVIPINIPPLRSRRDDVIPLTLFFLERYCDIYNKRKRFTQDTLGVFVNYDWPGNVRELKNCVERAVVMNIEDTIKITKIQGISICSENSPVIEPTERDDVAVMRDPKAHEYSRLLDEGVSLGEYIGRCESEYIRYAINRYKSTYRAAEALGTSQSSVMRRKRKHKM